MKATTRNRCLSACIRLTCVLGLAGAFCSAQTAAQHSSTAASPSPAKSAQAAVTSSAKGAKPFDSTEQAADVLVSAADKFDVATLEQIFGPEGKDVVFTGDSAADRKHALDFAAQAKEKKSISLDPKGGTRAFLLVGDEDWPFPVPLVKVGTKWFFDAKAGAQELLYRRIGANELDAIAVCSGYVEAQDEYAVRRRKLYDVSQYAQKIISTPGTEDGLAWQDSDGTWQGPIGENIAKAIQQGLTTDADPYHGYFFKILKGQGPAAPLGEIDYVVKTVMIGGFALIAAPAQYGVTGIRSFIVSQDGVVYEKDLGPTTLNEFKKMERFNPDNSWKPVPESEP